MSDSQIRSSSKQATGIVRRYRRALPIWSQLFITAIVFSSGYVFGSMTTTQTINNRMETYRNNAPIFAEDIVDRLTGRLQLSDAQIVEVREIIERRHVQLIESRRSQSGAQQMHLEFDQLVADVSEVLDQDQVRQWRRISESVRFRFLPPLPSHR